jgi:hypothetical protein
MKPSAKRFLTALAAFVFGVVIVRIWLREEPVPEIQVPPVQVSGEAPAEIPQLLPARAATPENPVNSWERLLVADGTPVEDRASLEDIVINYLQSAPPSTRPPLGTNEEITRALMDRDALGDSAIPASHPAIVSGQLVDRWGSPWFFHQMSADLIEVSSAGPDRKLFTPDDVK